MLQVSLSKFFFGEKRKFLRKYVEKKKERNTKQCHLNITTIKATKFKKRKERNTKQCHLNITTIKATKFGMTLFNGKVSFKIFKIARF